MLNHLSGSHKDEPGSRLSCADDEVRLNNNLRQEGRPPPMTYADDVAAPGAVFFLGGPLREARIQIGTGTRLRTSGSTGSYRSGNSCRNR
jgi:hypothetical protein